MLGVPTKNPDAPLNKREHSWWLLIIFPDGIYDKDNTNSNNKENQIIAHTLREDEEGLSRTSQISCLPSGR
jgi:hypothetical protein